MKVFTLIAICSILCISCSENSSDERQALKEAESEASKPIIKEPIIVSAKHKPIPITNDIVVEKLTEYGNKNPETVVDIYTTKGKIRIRLYKDTPLHRANFILLTKSGYLNGCLFSRVAENFMAQCGGSYDELQKQIQDTLGSYTIPAEISKHHFHKRGTVGAARSYTNNPDKRSECDEFYFVEGERYNDLSLDHYAEQNGYTFSAAQKSYYRKNKGAAHIDGEHTVFGEIVNGYEVVTKLTHVETDSQDWPVVDLYIDSALVVK